MTEFSKLIVLQILCSVSLSKLEGQIFLNCMRIVSAY